MAKPWALGGALLSIVMGAGCSSPNNANIEVRKQNQTLQSEVDQLRKVHEQDRARIMALESRATTVPVLPQARLDKLVTVSEIELGRLTGGADLDNKTEGDEAIKVYLQPRDTNGDTLKATGNVTIEAFDLSKADQQRIGTWKFTPDEARGNWVGLLVRAFVFTCKWQDVPQHPDITIKVTFEDELTARVFTKETLVKVKLPAQGK